MFEGTIMKTKQALVVLAFTLISTSLVIAAPNSEHYIFKYNSGYSFDIKLTDNTITWKALDGSNKGQTESDYINRRMLLNNTEVIQWIENDGTFVTVIFDRIHNEVISSGKSSSETWLWSGISESI